MSDSDGKSKEGVRGTACVWRGSRPSLIRVEGQAKSIDLPNGGD